MGDKNKCKYGEKCYRTNPNHLEEYDHSPEVTQLGSPTGKRKRDDGPSQARKMKQTKLNFVRIAKPLDVLRGDGAALRRSPRKVAGSAKRKGLSPRKVKAVFDDDVEEKIVTRKKTKQDDSESHNEDNMKIDEEEEDAKMNVKKETGQVKIMKRESPKEAPTRPKKPSKKRRPQPKGKPVTSIEESSDAESEPESKEKESEERIPTPEPSVVCESDEESDLPCNTVQEKMKRLFLVDMPDDFYLLYEYFKSIDKTSPKNAMAKYGIKLVGPFDVLSGDLSPGDVPREKALCHWRFYLDPPEMQTVMVAKDCHYGYWRDEPADPRPFVVSNSPPDPTIHAYAPNLFAALRLHLEAYIRSANVFDANAASRTLAELKKYCGEQKIALTDSSDPALLARKKATVARTFNQLGIVVPYDKKTQVGYRPLIETDARLKKMCLAVIKLAGVEREEADRKASQRAELPCEVHDKKDRKMPSAIDVKMSEIEHLVNAANIANDECDFGNGLELGLDLFCMNSPLFRSSVEHLLTTAYTLLGRPEFAKIITAHLYYRHRFKRLEPSALRNTSQASLRRNSATSPRLSGSAENSPTNNTNYVFLKEWLKTVEKSTTSETKRGVSSDTESHDGEFLRKKAQIVGVTINDSGSEYSVNLSPIRPGTTEWSEWCLLEEKAKETQNEVILSSDFEVENESWKWKIESWNTLPGPSAIDSSDSEYRDEEAPNAKCQHYGVSLSDADSEYSLCLSPPQPRPSSACTTTGKTNEEVILPDKEAPIAYGVSLGDSGSELSPPQPRPSSACTTGKTNEEVILPDKEAPIAYGVSLGDSGSELSPPQPRPSRLCTATGETNEDVIPTYRLSPSDSGSEYSLNLSLVRQAPSAPKEESDENPPNTEPRSSESHNGAGSGLNLSPFRPEMSPKKLPKIRLMKGAKCHTAAKENGDSKNETDEKSSAKNSNNASDDSGFEFM